MSRYVRIFFTFVLILPASLSVHAIVGGDIVNECGFPQVVSVNRCTAGLIHPEVIVTAAHCNPQPGALVSFGDARDDIAFSARVEDCWGPEASGPINDVRFCTLDRVVSELPPAPVIFGCEVTQYLNAGQAVVISGFGKTAIDNSSNRAKRWAQVRLQADKPEYANVAIVGEEGGPSPCPGDSGGPGLIQLDDGSWRTFGVVSGGTTGKSCNGEAGYPLLHVHVADFEASAIGIDITPCFDAQTGEWDSTSECGNFYAGDALGQGRWSNQCEGTPVVPQSFTCGMPSETSSSSSGSSATTGSAFSAVSILYLVFLSGLLRFGVKLNEL